ncbi:MAG: aspartate kinase [Treponema sp.]|nr:aspartate kinase [Treponema sp.]
MIVMKFGGSSVANAERVRHVAEIVRRELARKPVLVVSAMGNTTDHLIEAAEAALKTRSVSITKIEELHNKTIQELKLNAVVREEIRSMFEELRSLLIGISMIRELTNKTRDYLVSFGERLSARIMAAYLCSTGCKAKALDAWDAGFCSDSNFSSAWLLKKSWSLIPERLLPLVNEGLLPVLTGFIAKDEKGNITTLGRGGSDLSATVIAAACRAEEAQVWKDVDGILTADPHLVPDALPVDEVSYEEAAELAYFGSQVLHPRAMQPCAKIGIPVRVKNSYNPEAQGTLIVASVEKTRPVVAITSRKNVTLVDIVSTRMVGQSGFLKKVFSAFAEYGISVDMVATSEVSVSLTVDAEYDLTEVEATLSALSTVDIKTGKAIVTIVGDVKRSSEILSRVFGVCAAIGVQAQMLSQGASKVNISFIVNDTESPDVVKAIHHNFFGGNVC